MIHPDSMLFYLQQKVRMAREDLSLAEARLSTALHPANGCGLRGIARATVMAEVCKEAHAAAIEELRCYLEARNSKGLNAKTG